MLVEQLHKKFPDMQDLRVRDIRVDKSKRKVVCLLSYPNSPSLEPSTKSNVIAFVRECVPKGYFCDVKIVNDIFTELSFRTKLFEYLKNRYPIFKIQKERTVIKLADKNIQVVFYMSKLGKRNLEIANFLHELAEYFSTFTCYICSFDIHVDNTIIDVDQDTVLDQEKLVRLAINKELLRPSRHFSVSNVEKCVGKIIHGAPMYISDIRGQMNDCVLCGTVSAKTLKATAKDSTLYLCKFTLSDESGANIQCVLFVRFNITDFETIKQTTNKPDSEVLTISRTRAAANDRKMKKVMNIFEGMQVVVRGQIVQNNFSEKLEMKVFDLCSCKIDSDAGKLKDISPVPASYMVVQPEIFSEYKQSSFTETFLVNQEFAQKKFVVFHANVTGTNATKDKIVAICGVKIENGHIVEKFSTYINPENYIDEQLAKDINLESSKLLFFHTITELIPDLYKFTYGYALVGTNLSKLVAMLDYYAEPFGYKFTNALIDQTMLLDQMVEASTLKKHPNCSKIEDVCKHCKVSYAHSNYCVDNACAVANCLVSLANNFAK